MSASLKILPYLKGSLFPKLNQGAKVEIAGIESSSQIPKLIHQTFYTKTLPAELQKNVEHLQSLNPGWTYRLYDDADMLDFIEQHYEPHVRERFLRIDPAYGAARADLFRYLLVYKLGGVYLDIKASITTSFDESLRPDDRFVLSQWHNAGQFAQWGSHYDLAHVPGGEFQQWHIVAAPGHPFLKAIIETVLANIDRYNPSLHGTGKSGVIKVTGPVAYTSSIAPLLKMHPHRLLQDHQALGLVYSIYNKESDTRVNEVHKSTFRSHYSTLTQPVVTLTVRKRAFAAMTNVLNRPHHLIKVWKGRNLSKLAGRPSL